VTHDETDDVTQVMNLRSSGTYFVTGSDGVTTVAAQTTIAIKRSPIEVCRGRRGIGALGGAGSFGGAQYGRARTDVKCERQRRHDPGGGIRSSKMNQLIRPIAFLSSLVNPGVICFDALRALGIVRHGR
jgi:hypothetical protein